jgi:hypothetical protein
MLKRFLGLDQDNREAVLRALPLGGVGVEIGVWKGEFSRRILKTAKPKTLHLIDPWLVSDEGDRRDEAWYGAQKISQSEMDAIHDRVAAEFGEQIAAKQIFIHRGASRKVLSTFAENGVDFVYVDGDHSYEAVVDDLASALRVTRPGGLIVCDDYLLGAWWGDGVVRAVHEFLARAAVIVEAKLETQMVMRKLPAA